MGKQELDKPTELILKLSRDLLYLMKAIPPTVFGLSCLHFTPRCYCMSFSLFSCVLVITSLGHSLIFLHLPPKCNPIVLYLDHHWFYLTESSGLLNTFVFSAPAFILQTPMFSLSWLHVHFHMLSRSTKNVKLLQYLPAVFSSTLLL